ncbi:ATP-dependent DNA helicase [Pararhodospirillum photometricum]|uniref:Helicase c2 n=1 Tax=Pararhodospirillum photometricum DSM 122 TaxID=1150469 RepID=H6SIY2_PARPM|nr:ATP-dependent DNA helicase [Pararhodospirillum photometricum]CCG07947.1 Helicase c2 [Pararhodospirillum photometricum DSM 122]
MRPARFCAPTPRGLARSLGLPVPETPAEQARLLPWAVQTLLDDLALTPAKHRPEVRALAHLMARGGWPWGSAVLQALGDGPPPPQAAQLRALAVWTALPEVPELAPEPPPGTTPISPREAQARLAQVLGPQAESRPQQAQYTGAVCAAFDPRHHPDTPQVVLAEAGTGVGKTLGYIAPASLWAERNEATVWISTYTRNLQRQLDTELDRLYPNPDDKNTHVVVRKGRENYLCLLNFEEAAARVAAVPSEAPALGLMARWILATRDGDMVGSDFPGWLADLLGREVTLGLADRRGECLFSACEHVHRCFIERTIRRARRARLVVANHALVMVQAALGGIDDDSRPGRFVFDEGHHLFDAADAAFAAHLSAVETAEARRWLLGAEESGRSRARGLARRAEGLVDPEGDAAALLSDALEAARALPGPGWAARLAGAQPKGAVEHFLIEVRRQVLARAPGVEGPHSLEAEARPAEPELLEAARAVAAALTDLVEPLKAYAGALARRLDSEADTLETSTRTRLDSMVRSLERRAIGPLAAWKAMADGLAKDVPAEFVEWLTLDRVDGREMDVGLHRHWVDPTQPFAQTLGRRAQGFLVTSATLRDGNTDSEAAWIAAEARVGLRHLPGSCVRAAVPSPFDYVNATRVLVVTDVPREDAAQVAAAFRVLFLAAGGGALGLFTAVARLRAVHARIAPLLEEAGLPLYAQHVDAMDIGTLIAIFRDEEDACLLGTDAVRDGVDVPGRSLRLIVFDRVPWPRPDLLHKARRATWGGSAYDDRLTRLRLKQAFGRLVRRADDRGVFVMLDNRMPTRLTSAFPAGVTVERVGLAEAVAIVRAHCLTLTARAPSLP